MQRRLFIGLSLPSEIRQNLTLYRQKLRNTQWIDPAFMHLTLRFLGPTSEKDFTEIDLAFSNLQHSEFYLTLSSSGEFGHKRRRGSFWGGVEKNPSLMKLKSSIDRTLEKIGFKTDPRKFTPHITIGRYQKLEDVEIATFLQKSSAFKSSAFPVTHFHLYQSSGSYQDPFYTILTSYPLQRWQERAGG